jgi:hypothetical protein
MRWEVYAAYMGKRRRAYRVFVGKVDGRKDMKDPGVDGRIILKLILKNWDGAID